MTRSEPVVVAQLREALSTSPKSRPLAMRTVVMNMLLRTRGISEYLTLCTKQNLEQLSNSCSILHVSPGDILANEGENFDCCFIVITGSVNIFKWKSKKYRTDDDRDGKEKFKYKRYSVKKVVTKGVLIGEDVFERSFTWNCDVTVASEDTAICIVPVQQLLKHVGYVNKRSCNFMKCFWKYLHLWKYSKICNKDRSVTHYRDGLSTKLDNADHSSFFFNSHSDSSHNPLEKCDDDTSVDEPITRGNVQKWLTKRAYVRCFRPGEVIFDQGSESHLLYVVMLGECGLIRRLESSPSVVKSLNSGDEKDENLSCVEVEYIILYYH